MTNSLQIVNQAFSKQSVHYDADDLQNSILKEWRSQVYDHVHQFLKPEHHMLELNAGTGLDALHFTSCGNKVLATDLSDGMIREIKQKIKQHSLFGRLNVEQLSYDSLHHLNNEKFDYVFSNFGGLNCIDDLSKVTRYLPLILNKGAYVTWVIMPKISIWEMLGALKGHGRKAFRRLKKGGVLAHLEGEYFPTYYHSISEIQKAFDKSFLFVETEGLGTLSPPPHRDDLAKNSPLLYASLRKLDEQVRSVFPFNQWGDHIIVTLQYHG